MRSRKPSNFHDRFQKAMNIRKMKQSDIVRLTGINRSSMSQYATGKFEPKQDKLDMIAMALNVNPVWLMGHDIPMNAPLINNENESIFPIPQTRIPLLGTIAAGEPILAEENIEEYIDLNDTVKADFCLRVKGTSMIGAGIKNGDIIFVRKQDTVEDGQIAAVLIEDKATLKRVYKFGDHIQLRSENPEMPPINVNGDSDVRILGLATYRLSKV